MPRLRLGVALLLEPPVSDEVDGLRRALGDRSLARVPPHVTLVPPVNVRAGEMGAVLAILRAAAAATPSVLDLTLGPPDTFLPANPVLYLPVGGAVDAVHALRDRVFRPPLARTLTWPFVAHVTLADDVGADRVEAAARVLSGYQAAAAVDRVHLLQEVRNGEPRWRPLADVEFGAPSVVARGGPLAVELVRSRVPDPEGRALLRAEGVDPGGGCDSGRVVWSLVVTARREGVVVGLAGAWLVPGGGRRGVLVGPAHRRQGIGRHLTAALTSAVIEAGWGGTDLRPVSPLDQANGMAE